MVRQPFSNHSVGRDPRWCHVVIDANAFDRLDDDVERVLALRAAGKIRLIAPGGVRAETLHPHTPAAVREIVSDQIFSLAVGLNDSERRLLARVIAILQGDAAPVIQDPGCIGRSCVTMRTAAHAGRRDMYV